MFASKFVGRRVIRKCCPHGESMDSPSNFDGWHECRRNEDLVTLFFEQLQSQDMSSELFFRFDRFKCDNPLRTTEFQLNSNGSLEIVIIAGYSSHRLLVSFERYCLNDVVAYDAFTGLPITSIQAFYCPEEEPHSNLLSTDELEFTEVQFTTESSFTTDLSMKSEIEPGESTIAVPKCCSLGHVMRENENNFDCHPLWWWPTTSFRDQPIDPAEIVSQSLSYDFLAYHNVSCLSHRWALANPVNFKRMFPYMTKIIKSNRYFESTWKIKFHSRSTRSSRITGTSKRKFNPFAPICYLSGRRLVLSINHKFSVASL